MKYSLRKSFSFRRRRETLNDDDQTSPKLDTNAHSTSNANLVQTKSHSNDEDDEPFTSISNSHQRPFNRFTSQIRRSFRNTLRRSRPRLTSTNSNKHLIFNSNEENNQTQIPIQTLYPNISTGLSCPMTENTQLKPSTKCRRAPLPPTHVNQS